MVTPHNATSCLMRVNNALEIAPIHAFRNVEVFTREACIGSRTDCDYIVVKNDNCRTIGRVHVVTEISFTAAEGIVTGYFIKCQTGNIFVKSFFIKILTNGI